MGSTPEYNKKWREANRERIREYEWRRARTKARRNYNANHKLQKTYGISLEERDELLVKQGGVCAANGCPEPSVVDHCHGTNKIRGILCHPCNLALGHAKEDISKLEGLIRYLKCHQ